MAITPTKKESVTPSCNPVADVILYHEVPICDQLKKNFESVRVAFAFRSYTLYEIEQIGEWYDIRT